MSIFGTSERLLPTQVQEQADQFLGTNETNGQFIPGVPTLLTGIVLRSDAGMAVDWEVYVSIPNPADPAAPQEWKSLSQTGVVVTSYDLEWRLPAGAKISVRTNNVVGADLKAQLIHEPFYRGT